MTELIDSFIQPAPLEPADRRWTREEYYRLAEDGFFNSQRVELIEGRIVEMPPQGLPHTVAVELVDRFLRRAFPRGHRFRVQMPFRAADGSDPEPDIAVVAGDPRDVMTTHPTSAVLIVEVSDTSLRYDRNKARIYAGSGIGEYWILNLLDGQLEMFRDPVIGLIASGSSYSTMSSYSRQEKIAPLAAASVSISVSELLP